MEAGKQVKSGLLSLKGIAELGVTKQEEEQDKNKAKPEEAMGMSIKNKEEAKLWFSSSHARMWELDHKESWAPKNWHFWTVVLEKTLESSLDFREIQPVHPKEISPEYSLEGLML